MRLQLLSEQNVDAKCLGNAVSCYMAGDFL